MDISKPSFLRLKMHLLCAWLVGFIFIANWHRQIALWIYLHIEYDWLAAYLTIFNVLLTCFLVIYEHLNGFATVWATNNLLCQIFQNLLANLGSNVDRACSSASDSECSHEVAMLPCLVMHWIRIGVYNNHISNSLQLTWNYPRGIFSGMLRYINSQLYSWPTRFYVETWVMTWWMDRS